MFTNSLAIDCVTALAIVLIDTIPLMKRGDELNLDLITNDAKFLLGSLYAVYIDRRKEKLPKNKAIYFEDVSSIHSSFMQEWLIEDVTDTCFELKKTWFNNRCFSLKYINSNQHFLRGNCYDGKQIQR